MTTVFATVLGEKPTAAWFKRLLYLFYNQTPMEVRNKALTGEIIEQYPIPENKKIREYYHTLELKKQTYTHA